MILSPFEWTIAKRYLLPGKGEAFIALVASISIGVVMLSVAMLVVVMSVMNGFRAELFDKIVGLNGHAVVQGYGGRLPDWQSVLAQARATPGVNNATPMIEQPLLATFNGRVAAHRTLSCAGECGLYPLLTTPPTGARLSLSPQDFTLNLRRALGLPLAHFQRPGSTCTCGVPHEASAWEGHHEVACVAGGLLDLRHPG